MRYEALCKHINLVVCTNVIDGFAVVAGEGVGENIGLVGLGFISLIILLPVM